MSYTDYLKRMAINRPVLIDSRMTFPDASSYTWRKKLETTSVNRRTDHVINNSQDTPAPRLFSPEVMGFAGSGFGGKVQDASSFTLSRSATSIGRDVFSGPDGGKHRTSTAAIVQCLTRPPASQVVSEYGNADGSSAGLNMGYTSLNGLPNQVGVCTQRFYPLTQSQFVDTIPDLKTRKIGSAPQPATEQSLGGRQVVQNPILCVTTNTAGDTKSSTDVDGNGIGVVGPKVTVPSNLHSEPPHNPEKAKFITGIQGPQTGGGDIPGSRAPKVGGVSVIRKGQLTHRGWATPSRNPYPHPRVAPTGAPAQLKINDANHYRF